MTKDLYDIKIDLKPHVLPITIWPDKSLFLPSEDVVKFDDEDNKHLEQLSLDILATIVYNDAIGMAAIQVGYPIKLFVIRAENNPIVFINPKIIETNDEQLIEIPEGCVSVPGYFEKRKRPGICIIRYQDLLGEEKELELSGVWSFVAQHEMEHLEGKTFIDGVSFLKKKYIGSKVKKALVKQKRNEEIKKRKVREAKLEQKTLASTLNITTQRESDK